MSVQQNWQTKAEKEEEDRPRPCDVFPSRIQRLVAHKMAILVVDVQNWTMDPGKFQIGEYFHAEARHKVIHNIQRLLAEARNEGNVEVVFTVIENFTRDGRDRSLDYKLSNFFIPKGSHDAKVVDELAPLEDEMVIPKTSSSLFNSTNFEYLMRNIGIETIGVVGFLTDQCVDQTIRDGADRGFRMICVDDACGTGSKERHVAALNAFKGYCRMESTDTLIAAMRQDFGGRRQK